MLQFCIFYSTELCGGLFIIIQDISRSNEVKFPLKTVGEHKAFLKKTSTCLFIYLFIYFGLVILYLVFECMYEKKRLN